MSALRSVSSAVTVTRRSAALCLSGWAPVWPLSTSSFVSRMRYCRASYLLSRRAPNPTQPRPVLHCATLLLTFSVNRFNSLLSCIIVIYMLQSHTVIVVLFTGGIFFWYFCHRRENLTEWGRGSLKVIWNSAGGLWTVVLWRVREWEHIIKRCRGSLKTTGNSLLFVNYNCLLNVCLFLP